MRRHIGQAGRGLVRALHALLHVAMGFAVVLAVAAGLLVWRLAQGPVLLDTLTPRLSARLNADLAPLRLHLNSVALAWEGWRGLDRPVDLRIGGLAVSDPDGTTLAQIPEARVSLSFGWLLLGRIVPRAIEIDGAHLKLFRLPDGGLSLSFDAGGTPAGGNVEDVGKPITDLVAVLGRPPQGDASKARVAHPRWTQLRRVHISHADLVMVDRRLGTVWHAPQADLDLVRHPAGGLSANATALLAVAGESVKLSAAADLPAGGGGAAISCRFGPLQPATLARLLPALAGPVSPLDAAIAGTVAVELGPGFGWRSGELRAELGQGAIRLAAGSVPMLGATLALEATPDRARLTRLRLVLAGRNGAGPVLRAQGAVARRDGHLLGTLEAETEQVPAADLERWWPAGVAMGARAWVTSNITAGMARSARVALALRADADGSHVGLTGASGHVDADNLTIHWLRPLPPVEGVRAELDLLSPDALVIKTAGGRQAETARQAIQARTGTVHVTGMAAKDQLGDIAVGLVGSVPEVLALLKQPRLHLLSKHPLDLRNPSGQVAADLSVKLPLDARVTFDQIAIQATGQLSALHLGAIAGKADLDHGRLDLKVDNDGLSTDGSGEIGGIPATIGVRMDFRAGPGTQVLRRYTVAADADTAQLAPLGLDADGMVAGRLGLRASVLQRRNGSGEADLSADLAGAELRVRPLGWRKPRGQPATASARLLLDRDRIFRIDRVAVQGPDVALAGSVAYERGRPDVVRLDRLVLGRTRGSGEIELPAGFGAPMRVRLAGASLDLSARLASSRQRAARTGTGDQAPDPPWSAELRFDRVLLAGQHALADVVAQAQSDGDVVREARISGRVGAAGGFAVSIAPSGRNHRTVAARASDAGALLRTLNVLSNIEGGTLALSASYDDRASGHPLSGTAELDSFRVRDAPAATRVLQGMTLYGAISALRGPGFGVARLIAPFRLRGDLLQLNEARAFSPSLGFTAQGWIDLARRLADVRGTIVPAYFFNSLLGRIPLLGTLFSPEKGGGVFAATYAVRGRLDDPAVSVNPLAALTPGFLRGLFGVFTGGNDRAEAAAAR